MANPNPDLQGWADRDEDPEWMENALARVRHRQKKVSRITTVRKNGTYIFYDDPFRVLLDEAAKRRGMGMTAYVRRAAAAFIAHDLGVPFTEVVRHSAKPQSVAERRVSSVRTHDDGLGMGPWLIEGLKDLQGER
jgi:hypothetical protein